jgi:hypothetical protein
MKTIFFKVRIYLAKACFVSAAKIIDQMIVFIDNFNHSMFLGQCLKN